MRSADPVIPQIASGLNVEPATAALLSTAFTLPYALVQPVLGALADMFSKARLMLLCLLVLAASRRIACAHGAEFRNADGGARGGGHCRRRRGADRLCAGWRQRAGRAAPGRHGPHSVRGHDRKSLGRLGRRRDRRFARLARRVLRHRRSRPHRAGGRHSRLSRLGEAPGRFDLSSFVPNYRAIFSNPLAKILFRRGVSARRCSCTACFPTWRRCCTAPARPARRSPAW